MIQEFRVSNFKGFRKELKFSFDEYKNYEFNKEAIKDNTVKTCFIYGRNESGKSSLGLALFDIFINLTDNEKNLGLYNYFINLEHPEKPATFYYKFKFGESLLEYYYEKTDVRIMLNESLKINGNEVIKYNHENNEGTVSLEGAQNLKINLAGKQIPFVKYIKNNAVIKRNSENDIINQFYEFVENMVLFSSLEKNQYIGYNVERESISKGIIEAGKLKDFEMFLKKCDIIYNLIEKKIDGEKCIYCKFSSSHEQNTYKIINKT